MSRIEKIVEALCHAPRNARFSDLATLCDHYFGQPRQRGTSHWIYRTPPPGDPRVDIQRGKRGMA